MYFDSCFGCIILSDVGADVAESDDSEMNDNVVENVQMDEIIEPGVLKLILCCCLKSVFDSLFRCECGSCSGGTNG